MSAEERREYNRQRSLEGLAKGRVTMKRQREAKAEAARQEAAQRALGARAL